MAATCPNGHVSESEDYCDTCGAPIASSAAAGANVPGQAGAAASPAGTSGPPPLPHQTGPVPPVSSAGSSAAAPAPAASSKPCPNCQTENANDALFCENCGYDFTTGALPRAPEPVSELDLGAPSAPVTAEAPAQAAAGEPSIAPPIPGTGGVQADAGAAWVAELWVDPDWYAQQDAEEPCPSPGLPVTVPLTSRSLLVGRTSNSRNIHPQLDCSNDIGVSRRHAQLTTDGQRWWVEDLQSSNGTFVGGARGPLPTQPVPPGQRKELDEDDRIYLGAWTRIVVRKTLPGEVFA
jgi:hypothetical protein